MITIQTALLIELIQRRRIRRNNFSNCLSRSSPTIAIDFCSSLLPDPLSVAAARLPFSMRFSFSRRYPLFPTPAAWVRQRLPRRPPLRSLRPHRPCSALWPSRWLRAVPRRLLGDCARTDAHCGVRGLQLRRGAPMAPDSGAVSVHRPIRRSPPPGLGGAARVKNAVEPGRVDGIVSARGGVSLHSATVVCSPFRGRLRNECKRIRQAIEAAHHDHPCQSGSLGIASRERRRVGDERRFPTLLRPNNILAP
jgi:hypothetical protein